MSLSAGTRLGLYEILGSLGAGGMGEVYRARDSRLGRDVALKVLPDAVAADAQRLARFEREAQVLASLNHPNIGGIHGIVEEPLADGGAGAPVRALVLELVEGPTLADRIARGPVPIDDAIPIARQIAEALEAAHEQGVVHRDLKPANVKVRPDGTVKVLDFGLAKALLGPTGSDAGSGSVSPDSPTLTALATQAGVILGTAAYMAPEQARGKPVDRRADIWAFGLVLYEMLTGRPAFHGETVSDLLTAVIRDAPDWSALPADVPPRVRELLTRCAEKDPRLRLRDIGEARVALSTPDARAGLGESRPLAVPAPRQPRARAWLAALPWAIAAAAIAVAGWAWLRPRSEAAPPMVAFGVALPAGYVLAQDDTPTLEISRDGRTLVFVAYGDAGSTLFRRTLERPQPVEIAGTAGAASPFLSPDARWVGFFADGKIKKVPIEGGTAVTLTPVEGYRGAAWSEQGWIVFSRGYSAPLFRVPEAGGQPVPVTTLDERARERSHRWPTVLPGGAWVLFTVGEVGRPNSYDDAPIAAVNVTTDERRTVFTGARMAKFAGSRTLLLSHGSTVLAADFDPSRVETASNQRVLREGVGGEASSGVGYFAASHTGVLALVPGQAIPQEKTLVLVSAEGRETVLEMDARSYYQPRFSPDGTRLVVAVGSGNAENDELWLYDLAGARMSRFTFVPGTAMPAWSRDGRWIAFARGAMAGTGNRLGISKKAADGSTDEIVVSAVAEASFPESWTPDGTALTGTSLERGTRSFLMPSGGGKLEWLDLGSGDTYWGATFSPDGRHLAYVSTETGIDEIFVQSWPLGRGKWQVSVDGGQFPVWSRDGKRIFYAKTSAIMAVDVDTSGTVQAGRPRELFRGPYLTRTAPVRNFDVGPGDRFVFVRRRTDVVAPRQLEVVIGW